MRTFRVVTSQHKPYYDLIGKDCIKTFLEFWPKEISLELWAEDFTPDISDPRLIVKDFNKVNPRLAEFVKLMESYTQEPKHLAKKKFWMKGHVVLSAMEECEQDVFVWLDSDVITNEPIPMSWFENLIPNDCLSVDIPAGGKVLGKEAETGFFMLNMRHLDSKQIVDDYRLGHTTLEITKASRLLETGVWWNAIKRAESQGAKTFHFPTAVNSIVPFMATDLAKYMRHWVTPKNKNQYQSGIKDKTLEER
jgi:hypothetical protein